MLPKKFALLAGLVIPRRLDQCFHVIKVVLQRLAPGGGEAIFGPRKASRKVLAAGNVIGFLQLAGVHAQVAICRVEEPLEIVEGQTLAGGKRTENTQANLLVDEAIETKRLGSSL